MQFIIGKYSKEVAMSALYPLSIVLKDNLSRNIYSHLEASHGMLRFLPPPFLHASAKLKKNISFLNPL